MANFAPQNPMYPYGFPWIPPPQNAAPHDAQTHQDATVAAAATAAAFRLNNHHNVIPSLDVMQNPYLQLHNTPAAFPFPPPPPPPPPHLLQNTAFPSPMPPPIHPTQISNPLRSYPSLHGSSASVANSVERSHAISAMSQQQHGTAQRPLQMPNRVIEMVNADKEEGELSESEQAPPHVARLSSTARPMDTRSTVLIPGISTLEQPDQRAGTSSVWGSDLNQLHSRPRIGADLQIGSASTEPSTVVMDDEIMKMAKDIIITLHPHMSFKDFTDYGLDPDLLAILFQKCGLETPTGHNGGMASEQITQEKRPATDINASPMSTHDSTTPASQSAGINTSRGNGDTATIAKSRNISTIPITTKIQPAKAAASPIDRQQYIARLMAAKAAKSGKPAVVSDASFPSTAVDTKGEDGIKSLELHTAKTNTEPSVVSEKAMEISPAEKRKMQTDLARQRILELASRRQNAQAGKSHLSSDPVPPSTEAPKSVDHSSKESIGDNPSQDKVFAEPKITGSLNKSETTSSLSSESQSNGIPGLFMTASVPIASDQPISLPILLETPRKEFQPSGSHAGSSRKRPVAADFDDRPASPASNLFRGTFGQPRHDNAQESMIIEVSDDESSGSVMDIDGDDDLPSTSLSSTGNRSVPTGSTLRPNLSALEIHSRPVLSRQLSQMPTSASNTPTMQNSALSDTDLRKREEEINRLKKKIAEAEARHKVKLSRTQTPSTPKSPMDMAANPIKDVLKIPERGRTASKTAQSSTGAPNVTIPLSIETRESSISTSEYSDWRRQRRAAIESDLPILDASMTSSKSRLEALRQEIALIEAENRQQSEDREKLVQELHSLEVVDTVTGGDPEPVDTIMCDELDDETDSAAVSLNRDVPNASLPSAGTPQDSLESHKQPSSPGQQSDVSEVFLQNDNNDPTTTQIQKLSLNGECDQAGESDDSDASSESMEISGDESDESLEDAGSLLSTGNAREPDTQGVSPPKLLSVATSSIRSPVQDEISDNFYSPEPTRPAQAEGKQKDTVGVSLGFTTDQIGLQSEMEESSDSEPEMSDQHKTRNMVGALESESEVLKEQTASGKEFASRGTTESTYVMPGLSQIARFQETADKQENSLSSSADSIPVTTNKNPGKLQAVIVPAEALVPDEIPKDSRPTSVTPYVPYESPLRIFKSFRYHPEFTKLVPGGFRSLTYSNQTDLNLPICRFEASGGTCNDSECKEQHFRAMGLSDDKILVQLGTVNPGQTDEERQNFTEGLKQVLRDLRSRHTKDANLNVVATEIANYRRNFLNDPTRVLAL